MPVSPATIRRKTAEFREGAAAYNNLIRLVNRRKQLANNIRRIEQNSQPTVNEWSAATRAARNANTDMKRRYFQRQANRLHRAIQPSEVRLRALTAEHNNITRQVEQLVPPRYPHIGAFVASLRRMQKAQDKIVKNISARKIQAAWRAKRRT